MKDTITLNYIKFITKKEEVKNKITELKEELINDESGSLLEYLGEHWIAALVVAAVIAIVLALITLAGEKITEEVTEIFS